MLSLRTNNALLVDRVLKVMLVPLELLDQMDQKEAKVYLDHVETREAQVREDLQDKKEKEVNLVPLALLVPREHPDQREDRWVLLSSFSHPQDYTFFFIRKFFLSQY